MDILISVSPSGVKNWDTTTHGGIFPKSVEPVIGDNDVVYLVGNEDKLLALDPADGHVLWSCPCDTYWASAETIDDQGVVYFRVMDRLLAFNPDGTVHFEYARRSAAS